MRAHEPLSWLLLERYALGELPRALLRQVEARLAVSAADRHCLATIRQDLTVLPALPGSTSGPREPAARPRWPALLALAAAALLWPRTQPPQPTERAHSALKGGELALTLISDRTGEHPSSFGPDERFKVRLTCPPDFTDPVRVLVFQDGRRYEPLAGPIRLVCGNQVPLEGAFSLAGTAPAEVCVSGSSRAATARSREDLADEAMCVGLLPRD